MNSRLGPSAYTTILIGRPQASLTSGELISVAVPAAILLADHRAAKAS
jgi:hypothetical protein